MQIGEKIRVYHTKQGRQSFDVHVYSGMILLNLDFDNYEFEYEEDKATE